MTYIRKLIAHKLGGLNSKVLELKPGLNLVFGPNEAGKTTWAAMIKLMFYGWGNKKTEKFDYERYCRDGGFSIGMEIENYRGKRLILERKRKDACDAFFEEGHEICPELTGAFPGEILFGVDRETFEKTAYIGQLDIASGKTKTMDKNLSAILSTGDAEGEISFDEAYAALDEINKNIAGRRRNSKLFAMREEKQQLEETLEENRNNLKNLNKLKAEILKTKKNLEKNRQILNNIDAYKARELLSSIQHLEESHKSLSLKIQTINEVITKEGIVPDEEFVSGLEDRLRKCESKLEAINREKSRLERQSYEINQLQDKKDALAKEIDKCRREQEKNKLLVLGSSLAVVLVLLVLLFLYTQPFLAMALLPVLLLAVGILYKITNGKFELVIKEKNSEIRGLDRQIKYVEQQMAELSEEEFNLEFKELIKFSNGYFKESMDLYSIKGELDLAKAKVLEIKGYKQELEVIKAKKEARLADNDISEVAERAKKAPQWIDITDENEIGMAVDKAEEEVVGLELEITKLETMIGMEGKGLDEVESELNAKTELIKEYEYKERASLHAMDALKEAYKEFSNRYAPELARSTGELFNKLTLDKYQSISLNQEFKIAVLGKNHNRLEEKKLSTGTSQQLWLALRLALCQLIFEKSQFNPPVILDDTFVNFDDKRCQAALELLIKTAKDRQIIMFTCHKREFEFLKDRDANIVLHDENWGI